MAVQQPSTTKGLRPFRPTQFGRYTLLMPLSVGGMGEIFLARLEGAQGFEKLCVIKKILPHLAEDAEFVSRFVNEARTLVKLTHGSIAQVLDMGLNQNEPYLAIEYVDGKDLRKVASRGRERNLPLPLTFVLFVMSRVLDALAYAHRKRDDEEKEIGLVHRDVSPQNILISYEGEVKVIDFGLAKSTLNSSKTNPSIILGKFLYMSPEQAKHGTVDRRSDLYSAGLCLYELISGKNPFEDIPPHQLMAAVASPSIPHVQQAEPLCPSNVAQLIMRALAVEPSQRFQNAEEFRGKLLACLVDIDASAGPESCSRFMRETFSAEYQAERKLLAQLKESAPKAELQPAPAPAARPLREVKAPLPRIERPPDEVVTPGPTDVRKYGMEPTVARSKPVEAKALSFAPTPKVGGGSQTHGERETMPGIVVDPALRREMLPAPDERATGPHLPVGRPGRPLVELTELTPTRPVPQQVARAAAMSAMNDEQLSPEDITSQIQMTPQPVSEPDLPSIVVGEALNPISYPAPKGPLGKPSTSKAVTSSVLIPAASVRIPEIVGPLPKALLEKGRPDDNIVTDRGTRSRRNNWLIVLMPMLAVLGLAGLVGWYSWGGYEKTESEEAERNAAFKHSNTDDRRARHVKDVVNDDNEPANSDAEQPNEAEVGPPAAPTPPAPSTASDPELDKALVPLPKEPAPASRKGKTPKVALSPSEECLQKLRATFNSVEKRIEEKTANSIRQKLEGMEGSVKTTPAGRDAKLLEGCIELRDKVQTLAK